MISEPTSDRKIDTPHAADAGFRPYYDVLKKQGIAVGICGCATPGIHLIKKGATPASFPLRCGIRLIQQYSCTFFQWAEFNDNGEPPWVKEEHLS